MRWAQRLRCRARSFGLLAVALLISGCGFALTHAPPRNHAELAYFSCTQSYVGPALDLLQAGGGLFYGVLVAASDEDDWGIFEEAKDEMTALFLVPAVVWGISGFVGVSKVRRCRAARDSLAVRTSRGTRQPVQLHLILPKLPGAQLAQPLPIRSDPVMRRDER